MRPDTDQAGRARWWQAGMILLAAAGLCWPALWNGYPLLCPDSVGYLGDGPGVWAGLLHGPAAGAVYYRRAEIYSLTLYLLGWGRSAWPGVVLQALATAWMVWLTVRSMGLRAPRRAYLFLMTVLCVGTGAAWFTSWVMPDVLGPVLYLGLALLVFAHETLGRVERGGVFAVCIWAIAAHPTHLAIAAVVGLVLAAAWMAGWAELRGRGWALVTMLGVLVAAVLAQTAVHLRVDGTASGPPGPPYLLARAVSDGPTREYLRLHCAERTWAICRFRVRLTDDSADFLWAPGGVWQGASETEQAAMRREQMPLLWAMLRAYPRAQLGRSWMNITGQLQDFRIVDFERNPWLAAHIGGALTHGDAVYARTRQARDAMPEAVCNRLQTAAVWTSAALIVLLLPGAWKDGRYAGLAVVVVVSVVVNAAVTGALSGVYARYQARVVWLVVVLAGVLVARFVEQFVARARERRATAAQASA